MKKIHSILAISLFLLISCSSEKQSVRIVNKNEGEFINKSLNYNNCLTAADKVSESDSAIINTQLNTSHKEFQPTGLKENSSFYDNQFIVNDNIPEAGQIFYSNSTNIRGSDQIIIKTGDGSKGLNKIHFNGSVEKFNKQNKNKSQKGLNESVDKHTLAVIGLVCGLLGLLAFPIFISGNLTLGVLFFTGLILSLGGAIIGKIALNKIKQDPDKTGKGMALAGYILGSIGAGLFIGVGFILLVIDSLFG